MKNYIWIFMAVFLVAVGCSFFAGCGKMLVTNTYEVSEAFDGISINTDTASIAFVPSSDGRCVVECREDEKARHAVAVKDEILNIDLIDKVAVRFGFYFGFPKITVYLPKAEYTSLLIEAMTGDIEIPKGFSFSDTDISLSTGDVDFNASASGTIAVETKTGDISIDDISASMLDLSVTTGRVDARGVTCDGEVKIDVTTGKVTMTDIRCKSAVSSGSTGAIFLNNVIAEDRLSIKRSTGNVRLDGSDAAEIYIKTSTGKVSGSLLSEKIFFAQTNTGRVDVPKSTGGGRCEITTHTGDIKITINQP